MPIYYGSAPFALKQGSQALNLYYGSTLISGGIFGSMALGMNVSWVTSWSGAVIFSNLMWHARGPGQRVGTGAFTVDQGLINASVSTDRFQYVVQDSRSLMPFGTYTILNPDGLKVAIGGSSDPGTYSTATEQTYVMDSGTLADTFCLWVEGSVTNTNGNLAVILPGYRDLWLSGDYFTQEFIDFYNQLNVGYVRLMDWAVVSDNIETNWADRAIVNRPTLQTAASNGSCVPYEVMMSLANRLGLDVWVCVPPRATQSYVDSMAALFASGMPASRSVWVEGVGNEIWNTGAPWGDGTHWVSYLDFTKKTATANYGANTFTLAGHGLVHGHTAKSFATIENRTSRIDVAWTLEYGAETWIDVIDANNFSLRYGSVAGDIQPVALGQINVMLVDTGEAGKTSNQDVNYATIAFRNFQAFTAAMGSRAKRVLGSFATLPSKTASRIGASGVSAVTDYVAIAPYFYCDWWGASVDVSSGSLALGIWCSDSRTVHVAVYPSGATPTIGDLIAGTGATHHATSSYSNNPSAYTTISTASGLTNGTTYDLYFVLIDENGYKWVISGSASPSVTASTTYLYENYAQFASRCKIGSSAAAAQIVAHAAVSDGKPIIGYEGGMHLSDQSPSNMSTWIRGSFQESSDYADVIGDYLYKMAEAGCKQLHWYADTLGSTFAIANGFGDTADARFQKYKGYSGYISVASQLEVSNTIASDILAAPSYPYVVSSLPATATYKIISGNDDGNFDISGNNLRMVSGNGVNWTAPTGRVIVVEAKDAFRSKLINVTFSTGNAWYESDANFAWNSIEDIDNVQINPTIGSALPLTVGSGATIASGLWDMNHTNVYYSATGSVASHSTSVPWLAAVVLDLDDTPNGYDTAFQFGSDKGIKFTVEFTKTDFRAKAFYTGLAITFPKVATSTPTGKHVFWLFLDGAIPDSVCQAGYDQVNGESAVVTGWAGRTIDRNVTVGSNSFAAAQSYMKHGSMQSVVRAGMTLADAKAIVAKMQALHGIA